LFRGFLELIVPVYNINKGFNLSKGVPPDVIAQSAGMPIEKIQALAG
jgi:hypothetical protein